ncbi:MAG: P63C domain-containing protein [Alphaproteobacteria bacterium]|uniref:P63C domain-containing protein n=1 Tax=Candidatus Nitrobium versatile TaxID=2884831 RepID=A0A953SH70_9BACT|nr:P63C domain-containing protein [Candidatus Nitrobium versatile]
MILFYSKTNKFVKKKMHVRIDQPKQAHRNHQKGILILARASIDKILHTFLYSTILAQARMRYCGGIMSENERLDGELAEAAKKLSSLGAKKGGEARALSLTPEKRSEIARNAVMKRWESNKGESLPIATYGSPDRPLKIGGAEIPCYVLDNGKRVLVQGAMLTALDMKQGTAGRGTGDRLLKFLSTRSIKPFADKYLNNMIIEPIKFRTAGGNIAHGYEATILADICDAVLEARKEGKLNYQQEHIARQCEILVRGFARVGIIALVDEVTGYQDKRTKEALQQILEQFIAKELQPWVKTFPDDFYKEIFRLNGWPFNTNSIKKRPGVIGTWTNDIVYARLAPGVREELHRIAERDEKGRPKHKLFQRLTESTGHPKLREHLVVVTTLMKAAGNWKEFKRMIQRALPAYNTNLELPLDEENG